MDFSALKLSTPLLKAVEEVGYTQPSPIQQKAIPPVLEGYDLMGCAQTGTGKTAAFAMPMLQLLAAHRPNHRKVRALVLTPTRELALQIGQNFAQYGKYLTLSHAVIFGGVGQAPQVEALQKGVDILVACPGRLNDLIGQGYVDLSALEIFVLDEADRMLDMGFVHDVKKVIRQLPAKRQNLMFSATMPKEIEELAHSILHAPVTVKVDPVSSTVDKIDQSLYFVAKADKPKLLVQLVRPASVKNALVFSRTKHGADKIARILNKEGVSAAAIHGNKSQTARVNALEGFRAGKVKVLVATDIAARGIDISELSHVFNYDLPEVPETYVHRIGRTARAGQSGVAISFCSAEEVEYLAGIQKLNRKTIPVVEDHPWALDLEAPALPAERRNARAAKAPKTVKAVRPAAERQAQPAPAPEKIAPRNEEKPVEEKQEQSAAGLSASAKRRRRRRRAAARPEGAAAPQTAGQSAQNPQPAQKEQPAQQKSAKQPRSAKPAQPARQPRQSSGKPARSAAAPKPAAKQQPARSAARPAARQQAPKATARNTQPLSRREEDPGLLLISRKPPKQKFANFEEYIKSHGGVTVPIEGDGEE